MDNNMRFGDYANNKMNELMKTLLDVIFEFAKNEGSKAISDKLSEVIEWVNVTIQSPKQTDLEIMKVKPEKQLSQL